MTKFFKFFMMLAAVGTLALTSCDDDSDGGTALPPSFTTPATAQVQTGTTATISITGISTPAGFSSMTAQVEAGSGTVSVTSEPAAGATTGTGEVTFDASGVPDAGTSVVEVTITDNAGQTTSQRTTVSITTTPPPTVESITGITPQDDDDFFLSLSTKNGQPVVLLRGTVDRSISLNVPNEGYSWVLSGGIFVVTNEGAADETTLTIAPGQTIYFDAQSASTSFLAIQRDANIDADGGDAAGTITMTTSEELGTGGNPAGGQWGGLIVNGNAPINVGDEAEGEGGTGVYGGDDPTDNSGTMRYIVLKFPGRIVGVDNELNGFSFNGCGNQTVCEFLQSWKGEDDGLEWFGGTVNVRYAVSTGSLDDSFDWTHGWMGNGQWMVVQQDGDGDRGIEADNLEANFEARPNSRPVLSNLTLVGNADGDVGMRLRHGTQGAIHNALVTGFGGGGIRVDEDGITDGHVDTDSLVVTNSIAFSNDTGRELRNAAVRFFDDGLGGPGTGDKAAAVDTTISSNPLTDGVIGVVTTGENVGPVDPSTVYGTEFFTSVSYIGAVDPANNWLTGWVLRPDGTTY